MRAATFASFVLACVTLTVAQNPAGGPGRGAGPGPGRGAQGRGSVPLGPPLVGPMSAKFSPPWGTVRTGAQLLLNWRVGIPLSVFSKMTFADAAVKADALGVAFVQGYDGQQVSLGVQRNLGGGLFAGERKEVGYRLQALRLQMPVFTVAAMSSREADNRKLFEFARELRIQTIATEKIPEDLGFVEKLANEFEVNVALCGDLKAALAAIQGRGERIGICGDTGAWMEQGIHPADALQQVGKRLFTLTLKDRSALGTGGRPTRLGAGAGRIPEVLNAMYEMEIAPSILTVIPGSGTDVSAELERALQDFERIAQPVMAKRVAEIWNSTPIKGRERLTPEQVKAIEAALPPAAAVQPKKPRKLLVVDVNVGYGGSRGGHATIPAANVAIEMMGKKTGAWQTVLSNDINNFNYETLKQFDAVFLNNTVGMLFEDPEVRAALLRFVREGGGLAAYHGASHTSMDWPEFGEMLGARQENSRTEIESPSLDDPNNPLRAWQPPSSNEILTLKLDDPKSPLNAPFAGKEVVVNDEIYRFYEEPYSRERLHVLLSIDTNKTDMAQGVCSRNQWEHSHGCTRADNDYAIAWIRSYGKGRVFYNALGNDMTLFMKPAMVEHFLRAIQFVLGDLDADTTPSAKLTSRK